MATREQVQTLYDDGHRPTCLAITEDGKKVVSGAANGALW